jgi:hypothetical protein
MTELERESQHGEAGFNAGLERFAEKLADFYSSLAFRFELLDDARRHFNAYLARDFNVFDYIEPDENKLSRVIKDLLSPDGTHGQGTVFLDQFLTAIGHPLRCAHSKSARVRCQTQATHVREGGLIDITIDLGDFGVGIENKPTAVEQDGQLWRYWQHLEARYRGGFCLVYLDGKGTTPESIPEDHRRRLEAEGKFKIMSYVPDLQRWLEGCAKESKADKLRWFLRDFAEYVGQIQESPEGDRQ